MGLCELGEQDLVRSNFEDRPAENDCALRLRNVPVAGAAMLGRERVHLSLPDYRATVAVAAFSLASHQAASGLSRAALARSAAFIRKLFGQWRCFALCGPAIARPPQL